MSLEDLCNDFWDDIISLMDYKIIAMISQPKRGLSRIEAIRAYFMIDPSFIEKLESYLHLEASEAKRERQMLLKVS